MTSDVILVVPAVDGTIAFSMPPEKRQVSEVTKEATRSKSHYLGHSHGRYRPLPTSSGHIPTGVLLIYPSARSTGLFSPEIGIEETAFLHLTGDGLARKRYSECRSTSIRAHATPYTYLAVMMIDDLLRKSETKACALFSLCGEERFKDNVDMFRGNAVTIVCD